MLVIISCEVDLLIANLFREHHRRHEVQGSCLREDGRERSERPFIHMAEAEHRPRSEEHTSELQSRLHLVCRLLLEKKKKRHIKSTNVREIALRTSVL